MKKIILCVAIILSMTLFNITTFAASKPDDDTATETLGSYNGDIDYACKSIYANKWFKKDGSKIYIDVNLGTYSSKNDAENRDNPMSPAGTFTVYLYDEDFKSVGSKEFKADCNEHTAKFYISKNKKYCVLFTFGGDKYYYFGGDFTVR